MSKNYVINSINNFIYRIYNIITKVTKIDESHTLFDLGNNCKFVLNVDAIKTYADLNTFVLDLTSRMNKILMSA